ncbi:hypothetical protein JXQ70_10390 [bacterium]|nr:hypothetical protein [bacterium]
MHMVHRTWWMKVLQKSKLYYCPGCSRKFLVWHEWVLFSFLSLDKGSRNESV